MASRAKTVNDLMVDFGKTSPDARAKIDKKVGEITVDLLSQNEGRFKALEKTVSISILTSTREYRLPADFNTAKRTFFEVDDDGNFIAECSVLTKSEIHRRYNDGRYAGYRLCFIKHITDNTAGPGLYLVLAADAPGAKTWEFDYYREPAETDAEVIRNTKILKQGVKADLIEFNLRAADDMVIYLRMREGFKEDVEKYLTKTRVIPPRNVIILNTLMNVIADGK